MGQHDRDVCTCTQCMVRRAAQLIWQLELAKRRMILVPLMLDVNASAFANCLDEDRVEVWIVDAVVVRVDMRR